MKRRVSEREILTDDSITTEGGKDKTKAVIKSLNYKLRDEADIEEVLKKLQKLSKLVQTNAANSHSGVEGINCKVSRKESFMDVAAREGTELEAVLKELEISRFKRVASKDDKVRRSQAKRRLVGKTPGSMEEKLTTSELNIPLKLVPLNEILDGTVDMPTVSSTVVQNLAKRKAIKKRAAPYSVLSVSVDDSNRRRKVISSTKSQEMLEESKKIAEEADLRQHFEVEADLLEEQCRAKAQEKLVTIMDEEFKKVDEARKKDLPARGGEKPNVREADSGEGRVPVGVGKLYKLRYTKAGITAFSEGNYEEMEIMDEEEVEEREGGLNTAEKTDADNQETINQEIENSCLRVVDLEGLLEVEKKFSAELQELDTAREREKLTLLYNAEYSEEYEALISQYEDRLDYNVKLSLKLEEAKRQVEEKTATILSRDLALN
ncbi:hypothetical protein GIB67_008055 [Kingdonia uniflora]|uniref:Uncharacterized protein n=1 Tax=Kingdonia uniflora TaxID=39325 RepID=A0A7J7MMW0_9MAGN|nr:hypothetical protein GIB67_008055 [Kingdonia uniflora]